MLQERPETAPLKETAPDCAPRVVVEMTEERSDTVPYAKPDWVAFEPPVEEMVAFKVAPVWVIEDAAFVATVWAHGEVVKFESPEYAVPPLFTAYAAK